MRMFMWIVLILSGVVLVMAFFMPKSRYNLTALGLVLWLIGNIIKMVQHL